MFAAKSTCGFYDPSFQQCIPDDAVEITADEHMVLLEGQGKGKLISWGDDGYPFLTEMPAPSPEQLATVERAWRDSRLSATDSVVARHRDEQEEALGTTLTSEQYVELQTYRRTLRNWPEAGGFPLSEHRPPAPTWLSTLPQ
ncbi:phage tail protein [Pseudomonas sp. WS 5532]|nr:MULTISPECIES: phage tail assembly chaperone [unclassified Pseudomonas]NMX71837.1 phage tail protein [Pseudomonas sp. WS 5532]QXI60480.1 phage tail assembly chaperone [Pseudomonas sp. OE 28.3]